MSRSRLKTELSADEVTALVQWFMDSYDDGWRPDLYVANFEQARRDRFEELYDRHIRNDR